MLFLSLDSRGEKTRTSDLHVPNVARCQLCYTPSAFNRAQSYNFSAKETTFSGNNSFLLRE